MVASFVLVSAFTIWFGLGVSLLLEDFDVMICILTVLCLVAVNVMLACSYADGFMAYRSVCPECGYVCTDEEFTNCPKDGNELIVAWEGEKDE